MPCSAIVNSEELSTIELLNTALPIQNGIAEMGVSVAFVVRVMDAEPIVAQK